MKALAYRLQRTDALALPKKLLISKAVQSCNNTLTATWFFITLHEFSIFEISTQFKICDWDLKRNFAYGNLRDFEISLDISNFLLNLKFIQCCHFHLMFLAFLVFLMIFFLIFTMDILLMKIIYQLVEWFMTFDQWK